MQCGLCRATCPEKVITLVPRIDFSASRTPVRILKEEEPFCCIRCGKPFGVKSSIERVVAKLEGKHWMYTGASKRLDVIKMCEDCRVAFVAEQGFESYGAPGPAARTTDDYLREREREDATASRQAARNRSADGYSIRRLLRNSCRYDWKLLLAQSRHSLRVQLEMRVHEFGRRQRQPLIEGHIGIIAALENLEEAQRSVTGVLDVVSHGEGHITHVARLKVEGASLAGCCEHAHPRLAFDIILPFVVIGMPMQLAHATGQNLD